MQNLGIVLINLGDYASAKTYYEKALKINEKHYGADHPQTALTMMNLGTVLNNLGDYPSAKTYYQKALKINETHYGPTHPNTASTMGNLGIVLQKQGHYAEAKTYYQKALKIKEKHYGPTHPQTAMTMGNLGNLFKELGQYEKARGYYEKMIAIFTLHYGANHAMTKKAKRILDTILEEEIASKSKQKQSKAPKIDKAKQQEVALIQATCHFVTAMKGQLANTAVPAYLESTQWDANAAATFVAAVLRMYRKQQYPHALAQAENHGLPTALVPFIKVYISSHPQLQQVAQRTEFCKSHLENPLMLGEIDQLRAQSQPNEEKKDESPNDKDVFDLD